MVHSGLVITMSSWVCREGVPPPFFILSALLLPLSGDSFECKAVAASIFKIRSTVPAHHTNFQPE
jgi:hypothetical protein